MPATSRRTASKAIAPSPAPAALPNIVQMMDDPHLCGPFFREDSWGAWRVFLRALFALPMSAADLETYHRHTGRTRPPSKPFHEAALVVGRGGGKSRILALIGLYYALRDYRATLGPGELAILGIIAADKGQAAQVLRYIVGMLTEIPTLAGRIVAQTNESVTLNNRVQIEVGVASLRSTRGFSYCAILADENAFWRNDEISANPDVEVLNAVRPGLDRVPGSLLLLASSPYAKRGALYETHRDHYGRDDSDVLVWQAGTMAMRPSFPLAKVQRAYAQDPAVAAAEYGAEFRSDIAAFVDRAVVEAVTDIGVTCRPGMPGVTYKAFLDVSGGRSDSMCLAIAHLEGDVGVLDLLEERPAPFNPDTVAAEFAEILLGYGVRTIRSDKFAGTWPVQAFQKHNVTCMQDAPPKTELYRDLLPLLTTSRCRLLDQERLSSQLCALERRTARGTGRDIIDHPRGHHDDCANVAAGVLVEVAGEEDTNAMWAAIAVAWEDEGPGSVRSRLFASHGN